MFVGIMSVVLTVLIVRLTVVLVEIIFASDGMVLRDEAMAILNTMGTVVSSVPLLTVMRGTVVCALVCNSVVTVMGLIMRVVLRVSVVAIVGGVV